MRDAFSKVLVRAAKDSSKLYLLTGDHGYALFDSLRKSYPERFINAGVAEQNMVGVAAGLSKMGFLPVIYGLSAFIPVRVLEQIKIDFCYENLPCVLVGDGAGVVYSHLGASHQSTEDIACLRALPNIRILSPADKFEMEACFNLALKTHAPVYLRIGKSDLSDVHTKVPSLKWGRPLTIKEGDGSITFIATGSMVSQAIRLAETVFTNASVLSVPCIKPLDTNEFFKIFSKAKNVFVLEEHAISGGLGSAICEIASAIGDVKVIRIGIKDRFSQMCGTYQYLMKEHGLDFDSLVKEVQTTLGTW